MSPQDKSPSHPILQYLCSYTGFYPKNSKHFSTAAKWTVPWNLVGVTLIGHGSYENFFSVHDWWKLRVAS